MGTWEKRAPLTGIIAFALFVLAFIIGGETPDFDASPDEALSFYVDNEGSQIAASILLFYGSLFLVFFATALRSRLRREAGSDGLATMSFAGGVLLALGIVIFAGLTFTLADGGDAFDPVTAQTLNALNGDFFFPVAIGTALFMLGAGLAILRDAALPRWLGWVAVVIGVVAATPGGFFAFLATGIWMAIAGILLTTRSGADSNAGATP